MKRKIKMELNHKFYKEIPKEAAEIRTEVFVDEQGFEEEFDEKDRECLHIVLFCGGVPAAVGRIYKDGEKAYAAGRIAVRKQFRGQKLGAEIMRLLEEKARELGAERMWVSAQCRAREFYEKSGYTAEGEVYLDQFCPHIHMEKPLK